ncbi:MAG: protein kinase, partial [Gemmatimonadota bacterium]
MIDAERAMQERLSQGLSGRYRVVREAGHGGMATVYEAMDIKHDRRVAMKVLRPEVAAALGKERFLSEIRIASQLSHPHILPVHESGEVDGLLFYVMPFVDGETLRERITREGKLAVEDARRITRDVGLALAYAHQQGVIHRDLKPENIMLSGGIAVVADFGIARAISSAGRERLTQTGLVPGTPAYMSPEQATGESEIDERSDVYSLGCVVYEMLAGEPPYDAATLMSMIAKHAVAPVPSLENSRPDVPNALARSVAIALAKTPAERFNSVREFVDSVEGHRVPPRHLREQPRMRLTWRAIAVSAVAVLAVAVALWVWRGRGPADTSSGIPTVAVLPFDHIGLPDEKYLTDGIVDELSGRIAEIGGVRVISRASAAQFSVARLREVAAELGASYVVAGSAKTERAGDGSTRIQITPRLMRVPGGEILWDESHAVSLSPGDLLKVQQDIAVRVANSLNVALRPDTRAPLEQGLTQNLEAYRYYLQANLSASQFLVRQEQAKAIELYERAVQLDPQFALAWARLAQTHATYFSLFDRTAPRMRSLEAATARATAMSPADPETQIARGYAALFARANTDSALRELTAARVRQPNNSRLLWAIGFIQRWRGELDSAEVSFAAASTRDPRSPMYAFEAVTIPFLRRDYVRTTQMIRRVRQLAPDWLPAFVTNASIELYAGNVQAARDSMRTFTFGIQQLTWQLIGEAFYRPLMEMIVPDTVHRTLDAMTLATVPVDSIAFFYAKGRLEMRQGDTVAARQFFETARRVALGRRATRPARIFEYVDLATMSMELGDVSAAVAYADSGLALRSMERFRTAFATLDVARVYARLGDVERALPLLRE